MPAYRLAEQPLDLGVDRAEVGGSPAFEIGPQVGVDAQQELLAPRHPALTGIAGCRRSGLTCGSRWSTTITHSPTLISHSLFIAPSWSEPTSSWAALGILAIAW